MFDGRKADIWGNRETINIPMVTISIKNLFDFLRTLKSLNTLLEFWLGLNLCLLAPEIAKFVFFIVEISYFNQI